MLEVLMARGCEVSDASTLFDEAESIARTLYRDEVSVQGAANAVRNIATIWNEGKRADADMFAEQLLSGSVLVSRWDGTVVPKWDLDA
jgi:hypothetical protein